MDTEEFTVSSVIPASPNRIYSAWMDERHHSAFTGARATVDPWVGGRVVADDGFIDATHVYLVTGSRIAMTWRTRDFPKGSNDSQVDISFSPVAGGTKVEVAHSNVPAGLGKACEKIWKSFYLAPMAKYFGEPDAMRAAYEAAKKAGQLPLSGIKASRPGPRRPFVPAPQLPVEETGEDEEDDEETPKKSRK
ncbi:MAG: SRPBCC domain-containing protein, partial [Polyangiales bacterium]